MWCVHRLKDANFELSIGRNCSIGSLAEELAGEGAGKPKGLEPMKT